MKVQSHLWNFGKLSQAKKKSVFNSITIVVIFKPSSFLLSNMENPSDQIVPIVKSVLENFALTWGLGYLSEWLDFAWIFMISWIPTEMTGFHLQKFITTIFRTSMLDFKNDFWCCSICLPKLFTKMRYVYHQTESQFQNSKFCWLGVTSHKDSCEDSVRQWGGTVSVE